MQYSKRGQKPKDMQMISADKEDKTRFLNLITPIIAAPSIVIQQEWLVGIFYQLMETQDSIVPETIECYIAAERGLVAKRQSFELRW